MSRIYYPTAQARIQLRLDEGKEVAALKSDLERRPPTAGMNASMPTLGEAEASNQLGREVLNANKSIMAPDEYLKQKSLLDTELRTIQFAKQSPLGGGRAARKMESLQERDSDSLNTIFTALPLSVEIDRNSIRDADTARITFAYSDLPIDPRIVRAGLVSITIGSVTPDEYQRGVVRREVRSSDGELVSIVERRSDEELKFFGTNTRFVGFIDEWKIDLDEGDDTVVLEMRDITAVLLDQELPDQWGVDLSLPLDEGVQHLLDQFTSVRGMQVFFGTPGEYERGVQLSAPVPEDSVPKLAKSAGGKKAKAQRQGDKDDNLFDHVTTVCAKLGYIAFVRGFVLFICESRAIYSEVANARKMVYGRNIKRLEFARKLGGITTQTVEVRSADRDRGRTLWARYPVLDGEPSGGILGDPSSPQPVVSRPQKVSPSGQPDEHVVVYQVRNVNNPEALARIARNTYEEMGRQEIEGSFETDDLDSFKENDDGVLPDLDLLSLYPGDAVMLLYAPPDESAPGDPFQQKPSSNRTSASAQELASMTFARRRDYLKSVGMSSTTAERLAAVAEGIPLANSFRVGSVSISFDAEEGISVESSFYNFITVREAADVPAFAPSDNLAQAMGNL